MWVDHFVYAFARYIRNNVVLVVFNNGYDDMPAPLGIPVIRNNDKKRQTLPDRVIDMMQNHSFINALDAADQVQLQNEKIDVQLKGKSFKIYAI
jgi:hypothetical protein